MKYSNFATTDYMKKNLTMLNYKKENSRGGIPIIWKSDDVYVSATDNQTLVIGGSGSGKTQTIILPTIKVSATANESMIICDVKGEIYEKTNELLKDKGYKTIVLNYSEPEKSVCYNPLMFAYDLYKSKSDNLTDLIENIGYYILGENSSADPFWINMSINLFIGIALYLFETVDKEYINISNIANIVMKLNKDDECADFLEKLDKEAKYYYYLNEVLITPNDTRKSIIAVTNQIIQAYVYREKIAKMMSISEFELKDLLQDKFAVFLIGDNKIANNCIPLFVDQVTNALNIYKIKRNIRIILDDFDDLKPIKDYTKMISDSRYLGIRYLVVSKSYTNLINQYGKENFEILRLCFNDFIYLNSNDLYTMECVSKLCGKGSKDRDLINPEEIRTLKMFEAIVILQRLMPYRATLIPDYKIEWNKEYKDSVLEERKLPEIKSIDK